MRRSQSSRWCKKVLLCLSSKAAQRLRLRCCEVSASASGFLPRPRFLDPVTAASAAFGDPFTDLASLARPPPAALPFLLLPLPLLLSLPLILPPLGPFDAPAGAAAAASSSLLLPASASDSLEPEEAAAPLPPPFAVPFAAAPAQQHPAHRAGTTMQQVQLTGQVTHVAGAQQLVSTVPDCQATS